MSPITSQNTISDNERVAERLREATEERERLLLRAARNHGLLADPEGDGSYLVRDPRTPGVVQITTTDSCTCAAHGIWGYCEHGALVRDLERRSEAVRRGGSAATVVATGGLVDGRLAVEHAGFWRLVVHQDGIMLSYVPVPLSGPGPAGSIDVLEFDLDASFLDVVSRLGESPARALAALFRLEAVAEQSSIEAA